MEPFKLYIEVKWGMNGLEVHGQAEHLTTPGRKYSSHSKTVDEMDASEYPVVTVTNVASNVIKDLLEV